MTTPAAPDRIADFLRNPKILEATRKIMLPYIEGLQRLTPEELLAEQRQQTFGWKEQAVREELERRAPADQINGLDVIAAEIQAHYEEWGLSLEEARGAVRYLDRAADDLEILAFEEEEQEREHERHRRSWTPTQRAQARQQEQRNEIERLRRESLEYTARRDREAREARKAAEALGPLSRWDHIGQGWLE